MQRARRVQGGLFIADGLRRQRAECVEAFPPQGRVQQPRPLPSSKNRGNGSATIGTSTENVGVRAAASGQSTRGGTVSLFECGTRRTGALRFGQIAVLGSLNAAATWS